MSSVPLAGRRPTTGARPTLSAQTRLRLQTAVEAAGLLATFVALFAVVQYATPGLADHDGFYHMGMARLMRLQGLRPNFVWLPLTILNQASPYDHHLLWHAYLSRFAGSSDPADLISGAKRRPCPNRRAVVGIPQLFRRLSDRTAKMLC